MHLLSFAISVVITKNVLKVLFRVEGGGGGGGRMSPFPSVSIPAQVYDHFCFRFQLLRTHSFEAVWGRLVEHQFPGGIIGGQHCHQVSQQNQHVFIHNRHL